MSNPDTNTTPKHSNDDKVINIDLLQRNNEDCNQTLEVFLSCVRNPKQQLGQRVFLKRKEHFAKDMQTLEKIGYVRNPDLQCFELPQKPKPCPFKKTPGAVVQIADNDPKFVEKMTWLENNDYNRDAVENCWIVDSLVNQSSSPSKHKETAKNVFNISKNVTAVTFLIIGSVVGFFIDAL